MRIGLVLDVLDGRIHGIGNYTYNVTKQLLRMDKKNEYTLIHVENQNPQNSYHDIFTKNNELVVELPMPMPRNIKRAVNKFIFLPRVLKKEKFDLIHETSQLKPLPYLQSLKVITIYDLKLLTLLDKGIYEGGVYGKIPDYVNHYLIKNLLKHHLHIITISECTKNELINHLKIDERDIIVIYEAVEHEKYKPMAKDRKILEKYGFPADKKAILYVGSEESRKNLTILIKAFYKLKKKNKDIRLIKVGNPMWNRGREKLLKLIGELNLQNDIIFTGYVPEGDLPRIYNAADLFVFPSLYEGGFGLPILEAMACGCPVITSNIPQLVETVGSDTGIMIDPYDVDGLARAMYEVLTNDGLREDMIKRGLERAKMFSWEKSARKTLEVYEEVYRGF